jgi:hypothetical protein
MPQKGNGSEKGRLLALQVATDDQSRTQAEPNHQDKVILTCSSTISHYFFRFPLTVTVEGGRQIECLNSKFRQ